jgi:hypothetical protein
MMDRHFSRGCLLITVVWSGTPDERGECRQPSDLLCSSLNLKEAAALDTTPHPSPPLQGGEEPKEPPLAGRVEVKGEGLRGGTHSIVLLVWLKPVAFSARSR